MNELKESEQLLIEIVKGAGIEPICVHGNKNPFDNNLYTTYIEFEIADKDYLLSICYHKNRKVYTYVFSEKGSETSIADGVLGKKYVIEYLRLFKQKKEREVIVQ